MQPRARTSPIGLVGAVLMIFGIACAGGYRIAASQEGHSYASGGAPPAALHVTAGATYLLSVPGGVNALKRAGADADHPQCQWSTPASGAQSLTLSPLGTSSRATDAIATFQAPYTGAISVTCLGWGPVYVDDADNASPDYAGMLILLAVIALTLGVAFVLSGLRGRWSGGPASEDEEIQRLVHVVRVRSDEDEVLDPDGGDVRP